MSYWVSGWRSLLSILDARRKRDSLRVNRIYWSNCDQVGKVEEEAGKLAEIMSANSFLDQLYSLAAADLNDHQFITYSEDTIRTDPEHRWGPAPYHYTENVYRNFLAAL